MPAHPDGSEGGWGGDSCLQGSLRGPPDAVCPVSLAQAGVLQGSGARPGPWLLAGCECSALPSSDGGQPTGEDLGFCHLGWGEPSPFLLSEP